MSVKTHLRDSLEPLKEGADMTAICGATVPSAAFLFMWDDYESLIDVTLLRVCRRCKDLELKGRYIYGIRSGEEQKQAAGRGE